MCVFITEFFRAKANLKILPRAKIGHMLPEKNLPLNVNPRYLEIVISYERNRFVLGSSSIWRCRILLLFCTGRHSGKNLNKYSKFDKSKLMSYREYNHKVKSFRHFQSVRHEMFFGDSSKLILSPILGMM